MDSVKLGRLRELRYKEELTKTEEKELNELSALEAEAFKKDPNLKLSNSK